MVIIAHDRPPYAVLLPYIVMWSLFGVHAGLRLVALSVPGEFPTWQDTAWVEAGYSLLSWTAKLYVFWTAFAYRYKSSHQALIAGVFAIVVFFALAWLYWRGQQKRANRDLRVQLSVPR